MSSGCSALCVCLVEETLGPVAAAVAKVLLSTSLPLPLLIYRTALPPNKVRQALCILIQHEMVYFVEHDAKVIYSAQPNMMESPSRYSRCILLAKQLLGEQAESIVEEMVCHGQLTPHKCIQNVHTRLATDMKELQNMFIKLVELEFITQCADVNVGDDTSAPTFTQPKNPFALPIFDPTSVIAASNRKRKHEEEETAPSVYKLNWDKLWKMRRDLLIVEIVENVFDQENEKHACRVMQAVLKLNESKKYPSACTSALLCAHDIVRTYNEMNSDTIDHTKASVYLNLISDHQSRFFRRSGDSGGGMYTIDFSTALHWLCCCTLESIIRERFGSRSVRIFRVILEHSYLEQNEIEQLTMLPSKDGKDLLYELLSNHYISIKEVCKTNDYAPSKSFFLFHVNLQSVAKMQLHLVNKSLMNLILCRKSQVANHKPLLDRREKVETIVANIQNDEQLDDDDKQSQIAEVEQAYLTVAEKELLNKHEKNVLKLHQAQILVEKTHFILQSYLFLAAK